MTPLTRQVVVTLEPSDNWDDFQAAIENAIRWYRQTGNAVMPPPAPRDPQPVQEQRDTPKQVKVGGWTQHTFDRMLKFIADDKKDNHLVMLQEAAENNGVITRDRIFTILNRPKTAQLNGITQPFRRAQLDLESQGAIPKLADPPFQPRYADHRAVSFVVPSRLIPFVQNSEFLAEWQVKQESKFRKAS